jgi:hypothetical protein
MPQSSGSFLCDDEITGTRRQDNRRETTRNVKRSRAAVKSEAPLTMVEMTRTQIDIPLSIDHRSLWGLKEAVKGAYSFGQMKMMACCVGGEIKATMLHAGLSFLSCSADPR